MHRSRLREPRRQLGAGCRVPEPSKASATKNGGACLSDAHCSGEVLCMGKVCRSPSCTAPEGTACFSDSDCGAGMRCAFWACERRM